MEKAITYGWSLAVSAKRYHRTAYQPMTLSPETSICGKRVIDETTTSQRMVPGFLTPCPKCFKAKESK